MGPVSIGVEVQRNTDGDTQSNTSIAKNNRSLVVSVNNTRYCLNISERYLVILKGFASLMEIKALIRRTISLSFSSTTEVNI